MAHSFPSWENQPGKGLCSAVQESPESTPGTRTMAPPPFSLTATTTSENEAPEEELVAQESELQVSQFSDGSDEENDNPTENNPSSSSVAQLQIEEEEENNQGESAIQMESMANEGSPSSPNSNKKGELGNEGSTDDSGTNGIVPSLMLFGEQLEIDLSDVDNSSSVLINFTILPGCVVTRIDVVIEEEAFVSGTMLIECSYLSGIDLELSIDATGAVSAEINLQHEILGFPTVINAQLTQDGITGNIEVQIPAGHQIVPGLITDGGTLFFLFGEEESLLKGNLSVSTEDGLATGTAQVVIDLQSSAWSGSLQITSKPNEVNMAPGVDLLLPEGFEINAQFGGEAGLTLEGAATVIPQVTLQSANGIEAGGTAEVDVRLGANGLDLVLKKVRLAVTGGLNAPDIDEVLAAHHIGSEVDAGALLTLWFEDSSLSRIDLEVTGGINSAERRIGRLSFAGQAKFNPFTFIGMLHAVTNAEFTLAEGDRFTTSLMPGSQFFLSMDESGVSNLDASLGIQVADQESALAQLKVASSLPRGQGLSLAVKLDLMRRLNLSTVEENGYGVSVLPAAGLGATMVDGALTGIQGALPFEVADQEGDLLSGMLDGQLSVSDSSTGVSLQNGLASATLMRDLSMELAAGEVKVLGGTSLEVRFEDGNLVSLGGQVAAVFNNGSRTINITASVDYDPHQKILRSLDATLSTEEAFSLFDGKLLVSEIEGGISIRNNEVISLGGHARLDAFLGDLTLSGEADVTWSDIGEETSFVGSGWLQFSWFGEEESDKYLNGRIEGTIDGDQFSLLGTVEMGLMPGLTGEATVFIDQEMDPLISASLSYTTVLMEASELWAMEFGMGIYIPIIPALVTLKAGILFGMSISTRPLMVFGTVGVENWRPKSNAFPDFHAQLGASWGLDIEAKAMAYLELILGIDGLLHLTGGVRAGVGLNIPIELTPQISLHGSDEGVWGEMGVDLSINPVLRLLIEAYMKWGVLGIWDGEKVWSLMDQELAELGNISWSGSFAFGDKQETSSNAQGVESQVVEPAGSPISTPDDLNENSSLGYGNQEQDPESEVGMTGMTDGLEAPSAEGQQNEVDQGGLGEQFQKVGEYADGVAAVGDLISVIADGFKALIKGGPVGLIIWVIFKKPSKAEIQEKRDRVGQFRQALSGEGFITTGSTIDIMLGILAGDYSFWTIFDKSKPFREMVDKGMHRDATLKDRAKMLEGMIDGWTGESDESRIIEVLDYTLSNEGAAGVRELTEYVGGVARVRDQYEYWDFNDRDDLDRIFGAAYGSNESSSSAESKPTYTAEEGATVKRSGRTWEELAWEAFGHESYSVYLRNFYFNLSEISKEEAYLDYQDNANNNSGPIGHPFDDEEPPMGGQSNSGPPRPGFIAYILKMSEIVALHEQSVWQERFQVPGVLQHAHWFENYEMIAQFAYGDANLDKQLKVHNPDVKEVEEGSELILPSAEELGPPWIEVAPVPVGSTGYQVWVSPDSNNEGEMWMGAPDRLVSDLAEEVLQHEEGKTAAEQLLQAATFTDETTQIEAENAVTVATNLIDFIFSSVFGTASGQGDQQLEDAQPGDTIQITLQDIRNAAEIIYGHPERAAWILVFNDNQGSSGQAASKLAGANQAQMMEFTPQSNGNSSGIQTIQLPTWTEMAALDPLPATARGIAPRSVIETVDGDTWAILAQKAYGDWSKALNLAEFSANSGLTMAAGTQVTLPSAGELNSVAEAAMLEVERATTGDSPGNIGKGGETSQADSITDNRNFSPGTNLIVKAGDTWSALALATYSDFSLFVRLSNHPLNVPFKTLPEDAEIYLPTLDELLEVPEFGLGLSPTGYPLLTEMVRVPTADELHHVWVENRASSGEEPDGVWMMASTPFMLRPEAEKVMEKTEDNPAIYADAIQVHEMTLGEQKTAAIVEKRKTIERLVNENYLASKFDDPTSITASVGRGGRNKKSDVQVVQRLLENANFSPQGIDGSIGSNTITAIEDFQQAVSLEKTGLVELNSPTWKKLKAYIPIEGDQYRGKSIDEVGKMGCPSDQFDTVNSIGANIRKAPNGEVKAAKIKYNETIRILCLETGNNPTWVYVISQSGAEGWVNKDWVAYPLPEPKATLIQVKNGWTDVFDFYNGDYTPQTGFDDRHILAALAMANNDRAGITIDRTKFNQHLDDNIIMGWLTNQNENNAIYNSIQIQKGANIWLYSWGHIDNLGKSGVIATRPELTNDLIDFANDFVEYDEIMEFFGNSDDIMAALRDDPGQFVDNMIEAVEGGFQQFGENASEHIFSGVTNWLLGDPDLDFPSSLTDLPGYANLALDILGIDWEDEIREAVGNDDLFDNAKDGFELLQNMVSNGPKAVLEEMGSEIGGVAEEIKGSLIEQLKEYAKNKIVLEAGKRIAAMFVPGAGILVAIQSIWKLIKSLYQQAEEIVKMLQAIGSAMAKIARGETAEAMDKVESGLSSIASLLIGTLFDFLNLGGIRDKIQGFIAKIQTKVRTLMKKVADFVKGKFDIHVNNSENLGIAGNTGNDGDDNRPVNRLPTRTRTVGNNKVEAQQLTKDGLTSGSSNSSYDIDGWDHARECNGTFDEWVRAHKISHRIGGPGDLTPRQNLFIANKKANGDFKTKAEGPAEDQLRKLANLKPSDGEYEEFKNKIMFYEVDYEMHGNDPHLNGFVKQVDFKWGYVEVNENDNLGSTSGDRVATVTVDAPPKNPDVSVYDINTTGWKTLWNVTKIDLNHKMKANFWQDVTLCRNSESFTYEDVSDLEEKLLFWEGKSISDQVVEEQCEILHHYIDENILTF